MNTRNTLTIVTLSTMLTLTACQGGVCYEDGDTAYCKDTAGEAMSTEQAATNKPGAASLSVPKSFHAVPVKTFATAYPNVPASTCGNNRCEAGENNNNCPQDCKPVCGNNVVEKGEQCDGQTVACTSMGYDGGTTPCNACRVASTHPGCYWERLFNKGSTMCHFTMQPLNPINPSSPPMAYYSCTCCKLVNAGSANPTCGSMMIGHWDGNLTPATTCTAGIP